MILFIVLLCAVGLALVFKPDIWWLRLEARKFAEDPGPSKRYLAVARAMGVLFTLAAVLLTYSQFVR